jgi:hypothetical protein
MRRIIIALTLAALVLTGCGGKSKKGALKAPVVPTITATSEVTTTTAPPAAPVSPLTGVPISDPARQARVALIVKIDNAPEARPQAGLIEADTVFEEQVEGGITRLAAVFQSADANPVGPVRSARSTDISIASELNHPLFGYSGANSVFLSLVRRAPLVDVGVDNQSSAYRRDNSRRAPHNLFATTTALFTHAPQNAGPPPPLFSFRAANEPLSGAGVAPATHLQVTFQSAVQTSIYDWDAAGGGWKRTENRTPHVDLAGRQVAPKNVIVQFVPYHNTGLVDPSGSPVPEANLIGQGEAWLLSGGAVVKGTWTKSSPTDVTKYADAAGAPLLLAPGQTWVELATPGTATVS